MQRLLVFAVISFLVVSLTACGNVFVRGAINTQTMSGTVSIVQLSLVSNGAGSTIQVTAVTLIGNGIAVSR